MTAFTYPLPQGVISAQLSERIQTVVQQALDDQRLYARAGVSYGMDASSINLEENLRRIASVPLLIDYSPELIFDAGAFPLAGAGMSGRFVSDLRDAVYGGLAVRP